MDIFTALWVGWLAFFGAVEAWTLSNNREGDTLSEKVWTWFAVEDGRPNWWSWARRITLGGFLVWLAAHMLTGGAV